jgi:hypothetical protein
VDRLELWLERWGGWLVAAMIHLALIAVFSNRILVIREIIQPKKPLSIRFQLPAPPPPPAIQPMAAPPLTLDEAVATVADPDARESDDPAQAPTAATSQKTFIGDSRMDALAQFDAAEAAKALLASDMTEQIQKELAELRRKQAMVNLDQDRVRMEVLKLEIEAKGRAFTIDSDGGRQGAIRTLDVSGAPEEVVATVFRKYHIRIDRNVPPSVPQRSFLNAAVTGEGTFQNAPVDGLRDVFVLSPTAVGMMAHLERNALSKRGFDPRRTRVREIQFGIVKNEKDEWDLGVTELKCEEIR